MERERDKNMSPDRTPADPRNLKLIKHIITYAQSQLL